MTISVSVPAVMIDLTAGPPPATNPPPPPPPATKPARKPVHKPTKKPVHKPVHKPTKKPSKKPSKKPAPKRVHKPSKKPSKKPHRGALFTLGLTHLETNHVQSIVSEVFHNLLESIIDLFRNLKVGDQPIPADGDEFQEFYTLLRYAVRIPAEA